MKLLQPSLRRRVTLAFFIGNALLMLLFLLALYPAAFLEEDEPWGPELPLLAASKDIVQGRKGLVLRPNGLASDFSDRHPSLWFHASVGPDEIRFGPVPPDVEAALARLPGVIREARLRDVGVRGAAGEVMISTVETAAGNARVVAGGVDSRTISFRDYLLYLYGNDFHWMVAITAVLAFGGALLVAPVLLRTIRPTVTAAADIDPRDVEKRLPEEGVVKELLPLVRAFNAALDRLAAAFEHRRRFIADVAHELRTPLAVLNMHIEELPDGGVKPQVQRTVFRIGQMIGQMLDAERLSLKGRRREQVDLVELARSATAEIAPLAVANGYEVEFSSESGKILIDADPDAVCRALTNLLGNAVAHGGGGGTIHVRVRHGRKVEVSDDGPGISPEARQRIFEPFHRERWDRDGCGLGLHLVREIMRAHNGEATVIPSSAGATFRLDFDTSR